jgi:hypothetical protein
MWQLEVAQRIQANPRPVPPKAGGTRAGHPTIFVLIVPIRYHDEIKTSQCTCNRRSDHGHFSQGPWCNG